MERRIPIRRLRGCDLFADIFLSSSGFDSYCGQLEVAADRNPPFHSFFREKIFFRK
ncbi:MAG: hypothetical protein HDR79_07255 [Bacteroides sp.]|nr:hypothetical protein [Bacteroides sp.]